MELFRFTPPPVVVPGTLPLFRLPELPEEEAALSRLPPIYRFWLAALRNPLLFAMVCPPYFVTALALPVLVFFVVVFLAPVVVVFLALLAR
jgi:hypothetical protein